MTIAKIGNAELAHFNKQMLIHELIRGSLGLVAIHQVLPIVIIEMEFLISIALFHRPLKTVQRPPLPVIDTIHYPRHVKINQVKPILAVDQYIV